MWLTIRRHPRQWNCLVNALLRYRFRMKVFKKRRAIQLVLVCFNVPMSDLFSFSLCFASNSFAIPVDSPNLFGEFMHSGKA